MIRKIKHNLALKLDSLGFIFSTACAIHCAAMPFVIVFLTLYGFQFIANPVVEFVFIISSIAIGIFTFRHGYFNHHRKIYPFAIFIIGLAIVLSGHFILDVHNHFEEVSQNEKLVWVISPIGAFMIGIGHFLNRKLSRVSNNKVCGC